MRKVCCCLSSHNRPVRLFCCATFWFVKAQLCGQFLGGETILSTEIICILHSRPVERDRVACWWGRWWAFVRPANEMQSGAPIWDGRLRPRCQNTNAPPVEQRPVLLWTSRVPWLVLLMCIRFNGWWYVAIIRRPKWIVSSGGLKPYEMDQFVGERLSSVKLSWSRHTPFGGG